MAAAVELVAAGKNVHVFEAGPALGGRARRINVAGPNGVDIEIDNGQHMLVGAYRELLRLMRLTDVNESETLQRLALDLDMYDGPTRTFRMACPKLPAPWHSAIGLLRAQGIGWQGRWAAIRAMTNARLAGWRLEQDTSVAVWLAAQQQPEKLIRCLWEPLTLAALNTPIATASAQILLNVLRDSLAGNRAASDFLLPRVDLSRVFPEAAARFVTQGGGEIHCNAMVRRLQKSPTGWQLDKRAHEYTQILIALPPHRLSMLAEGIPALTQSVEVLANWQYQPIYTVYLAYPSGTRLPKAMQGLVGTTTQWLFDRGALCGQDGIMAAIISAEGPHTRASQAALAQQVIEEVACAFPTLPAPIWHKVIAEKRATFACVSGINRPQNATRDPSLWLAGDYTAGDYPATLEGAVQSGIKAAKGMLSASVA